MSGKINSHICLMLSVYKCFHQMVKFGQQRNHISQDLKISMKASKTKSRFQTSFEQLRSSFEQAGINIPNLSMQ